jgi:hypothetical protein
MKKNNFIENALMKIRWPFGYLVFFICSCNQPSPVNMIVLSHADSVKETARIRNAFQEIEKIKTSIQTGDLITRTGNDFTSETLRNLNQRDKTFSHCGIAVIEDNSVFIYHALGGEFNPDQKLLRETLKTFAEPYSNKGIGVFRMNLTGSSMKQLQDEVQQRYKDGIMFDMDFDLQTEDRMYCAEFVAKSYRKVLHPQLEFNTSKLGKFKFIGVDDIFLNPHFKKLYSVVYK